MKRGKAGGYLYECIDGTVGKVISGTVVQINELGVYKAQVEVSGIAKLTNGGYSTFFPKRMMYLKGRWKNNFCISEGVIK